MREITTQVYPFDELTEEAQTRAVEVIRTKLGGDWWDSSDNDDIRDVMVYTLAEKLGTPGWDTYGVGDFPGGVTVDGFDVDRHQSLAVSGTLDRDNAPALPWLDGLDHVELKGYGSDSTTVRVQVVAPECTCPELDWVEALLSSHEDGCPSLAPSPVTDEQIGALEQAVRNALGAAWSAGEKETEYKTGEEWAREVAGDREFTEDGELYG